MDMHGTSPPPIPPAQRPQKTGGVLSTLFWAEHAPRARVLRIVAGVLTLLWLSALTMRMGPNGYLREEPVGGMGLEGHTKYIAIAGMVYALLSQGLRGFTGRPAWQSMALPLRTCWVMAPALAYQFAVALLMGTCWGLYRYFDGLDAPFSEPLQWLIILAAQGQAALLWCAAAGAVRGLGIFAASLGCAWIAGLLAANVGPLGPGANTAVLLAVGGWLSSYFAARASRGGAIPDLDLMRLPVAVRLRDWHCERAARKTAFTSPFWAQVWFEWRRSGWWITASVVGLALLTLLLDLPYILVSGVSLFEGGRDTGSGLRPVDIAVLLMPFLFWLAHTAVTRPYRRFVLTRPTTAIRVGRAKLLVAMIAAAAIATATQAIDWGYTLLLPSDIATQVRTPGDFLLDGIVAWCATATGYGLFLLYGPVLLLVFVFLFSLSFLATSRGGASAGLDTDLLFGVALSLLVLALWLIALALAFSYLKRRLDTQDYPFPFEIVVALAVLVLPLGMAVYERATGDATFGATVFTYAGPAVLMLSLTYYGHRAGLLSRKDQLALTGVFALVFITATLTAPVETDPAGYVWGMGRGYLIALALSTAVFYPVIIGSQWREPEKGATNTRPSGILLYFVPLIGIPLLFLGEELSEKEARSW